MKFLKKTKDCGCAKRRAKIKKAFSILIPTKNIYSPQRKWGMRKFQRGILHPIGFWSDSGGGGEAFNETITVGNEIYCSDGTSDDYLAFGWRTAGMGSITGTPADAPTYIDGGSNSRAVNACFFEEVGGGSCNSTGTDFHIDRAGFDIPNTDTTFVNIVYNGTTLTRASATYTANTGGDSRWRWSSQTSGPTGGTATLIVNI